MPIHHLDFIGQFTIDIRHVSGDQNIVADALSRIQEIRSLLDYSALAEESQEIDEQVKEYERSESGLRLRKIDVPGAGKCSAIQRGRHRDRS